MLSLPLVCKGQQHDAIRDGKLISMTTDNPDLISKQPLIEEGEATSRLFTLPAQQKIYYLRADFPEDIFMVIEFEKLSYWQQKGEVAEAIALAAGSVKGLSDSLSTSSPYGRKLELSVSEGNAAVIASLHCSQGAARYMVLKDGDLKNVKIQMDTITILKKQQAGKGKVLYTFILKDCKDITKLKEDPVSIAKADYSLDSLVQAKRKKWHDEDAWFHSFSAEYLQNRIKVESQPGITKMFNIQGDIGASFIYNSIVPYADLGVSYKWRRKDKTYPFVKVFASGLSTISNASGILQANGLLYANIETGMLFNELNSVIPVYKTSVGFGYKVASDHRQANDWDHRIFFNYSLSKVITLSADYYFSDKTDGQESKAYGGLGLMLRLF